MIQLQGQQSPAACQEEEDSRSPALETSGMLGWACPALLGHRPTHVAPAHSWDPFWGLDQSLLLGAQVTELGLCLNMALHDFGQVASFLWASVYLSVKGGW